MTTEFEDNVPVLLVGGGGAGLTASILRSRLGIRSMRVNRYPVTSRLPRRHILNQRTMEIFTDIGVAAEITAKATPPERMKVSGSIQALQAMGRRMAMVAGWASSRVGAGATPTRTTSQPARTPHPTCPAAHRADPQSAS